MTGGDIDDEVAGAQAEGGVVSADTSGVSRNQPEDPVGCAGPASALAEQAPDLVLLVVQGARRVAGPLVDLRAGRGRDLADVDALAAVDGGQLVVLAVAQRGDGVEGEHLVGGAVAGVLEDGGAVGRGASRDV